MIYIEDMDEVIVQSSKSSDHLFTLIRSVHAFFHHYSIELSCTPLTPGMWERKATESPIDRLQKLNYYIEVCEVLLQAACRNQTFSKIYVEFINF